MKLRFLLPLLIFGVLLVLFVVGLGINPREVPSPLIGRPAPHFSLTTLTAADQQITEAQFGQQPVALFNVWASWCTACREEHPFLMQLSQQAEIPIYGLNYKDERPDAIAWLRRFGNPYRIIGHDHDGRVGIDWGVYGVPETFIVDRHGTIRYKQIGPLTEQVWREQVAPLVAAIRAEAP